MAENPRRQRRFLLLAALALLAVVFVARRPFSPSSPDFAVKREAATTPAPVARGNSTPASVAPVESEVASSRSPAQPAVSFRANELFAYVKPASAPVLTAALPAPTRQIHYVRLNLALIEGKNSPFWQKPGEGRVELPLPDGGSLAVAVNATQTLGPDRFTSAGEISGRPGSRVIFAYNEGFMHASIEDVALGSYALRAATEELSQFYQVDPALIPACGGSPRPIVDADAVAAAAQRKLPVSRDPAKAGDGASSSAGGEIPLPATGAAAGTNVEIHILVAYTQAVLPTMTGNARTSAILSSIDAAIAQVNSDFSASLINARVKLVKVAETQYNEALGASSAVQTNALEALRQTNDGKMDELHALRDANGADLVCLLLNRADSSSIGIAYILDKVGDNFNPLFGFSVVEYAHMPGNHVFSHEIGHSIGCAHDRDNSEGEGAYPYSYGHRFRGQNQVLYHDIMAYDPGVRLGYFSNPNVIAPSPISVPVGVAEGQPGAADNARTIEQTAFEVATFRFQAQSEYSSGTLQAVSTRALAGSGEQALIGGFIITGAQKKKVLIRAGGPVLAPFLPNFLADPMVSLYQLTGSGPVLVGSNDDWGTNANAAQIGGLSPGSKDAALLVDLDPGAYTANITSANGSAGVARIDAYEADGNTTRLYALSTRAYADSGTPMIGGFTVGGAAGTTKRMLIRVRGPSIAGVTAMNDPFMEIYNGTGDRILINDDWSTGSAIVGGVADDTKPNVTYYKEQQIANSAEVYQTGLAPGNRREPAIMADFSPGNYTVIIKPFELLPEQVAQPGIAAVDVFEVLPK